MGNSADWDKALADADDPNALEPHDFDDSAAWAQMTALHWHLVRSLPDLGVETASPELFKDGTAFASSRIMEKTAPDITLAFVVLSRFGDLATVARCADATLLSRLIDVLSAFGLRYVDYDYVSGKAYRGKCARLVGTSWENRYFAMVVSHGEEPQRAERGVTPELTTTAAAPPMREDGRPRQSAARTALAGGIGNVLEWFDFAVYGYFATEIGRQFFPQSSPAAQQLLTFGVFALGFGARPIGSIVLGMVGDRIGRRTLLVLSIALMGGATLLIGLLPAYESIGVAAPVLLILLRLIQGFSVGGEFTGSMVYTTEQSAASSRGLVASSTAAGVTLGFILGSASAWLIRETLAPEQAAEWGWRIPFIGSVIFCVIGWMARRGLHETPAGLQAAAHRPPLIASLVSDWRPMLQTFGIVAMTNAAYYLAFTYAVDRRSSVATAGSTFLLANTAGLFVVLFSKPLGGWLSDYTGRRRLMLILTLATMILIYPALWLMLNGTPWLFWVGQSLLAIPLGMALGLQGAMVVEIFPLRTRVTSMSFAYSVTLALAGGTAPLVSTWLTQQFSDPLAPAYYIMVYGAIGLALMASMKETNTLSLTV